MGWYFLGTSYCTSKPSFSGQVLLGAYPKLRQMPSPVCVPQRTLLCKLPPGQGQSNAIQQFPFLLATPLLLSKEGKSEQYVMGFICMLLLKPHWYYFFHFYIGEQQGSQSLVTCVISVECIHNRKKRLCLKMGFSESNRDFFHCSYVSHAIQQTATCPYP